MSQKLLLIDGSNYLFRAFHGLPDLRTSTGEPTGALRGFFGMLSKVWGMTKPDRAVIVFDAPGKTFRHEKFPDYKANRPPMPDDLRVQIEPLLDVLPKLGWPLLIVKGVEADDVIATLAERARAQGFQSVIATGDKDLAQLVDDDIVLINTMNNKFYDREGVIEKYGVPPERIIDYLSLMGDKVDNVPGIEKCGPKTAAKWITAYGDLEGVKAHAQDVTGKVGEYLRAGLPFLDKARELVTIKRDCQLPEGWETLDAGLLKAASAEEIAQFSRRWEMSMTTLQRAAPMGLATTQQSDATSATLEQGSLFESASTSAPTASPVDALSHAAPVMPKEAVMAVGAAPDAVPYTSIDGEAELDALIKALAQPRTQPVALYGAFDGVALHAKWVALAIALTPKDVYVYHSGSDVSPELFWQALTPWLSAESAKVGHDVKTLWHAIASKGILPKGDWHDTMLMSYVLEAHLKHDLEPLSLRYLQRALTTQESVFGKRAKALLAQEVEPEVLKAWLAERAASIRALSSVMLTRLEQDEKLHGIYRRIEMPLVPVLAKMERTGVAIDCFKLAQESEELTRRTEALTAQAYDLAGGKFNLSSPKQLGEVLFERLGLPVVKKTSSGAPSTDEEVLTTLALDYPLPKIILEYRQLTKLISTYLDKLPRMMDPADARVHTTFGQATAVTGRLASSDPNLQNIPVRTPEGRRVREGFVSREGCKILSADYSQIELRIMAHLSSDEGLLKAFAQGRDVHRATAAEVFKKSLEEVTPDERRMAKVINFGLIYGMSAFGLAQNLGIDRKVAAHYIDEYFARYPGVKRYMELKRAEARENGYVETAFGRRLWIPDILSSRKPVQAAAERAAINAPMQGTAADLIKLAMIAVEKWLEDERLESRLILQVHDELILEVPIEELDQVQEAVPRLMAEVAQLSVPLIAEVGVGDNWDEAH